MRPEGGNEMNTTLECNTCGEEDQTICECNEYSHVYFIQLTMTNPDRWANPNPFLYSDDDGEPITFDTFDAATVMAHLMFGKDKKVATKIVRSA
jgi:hypothetical protein